MKFSGVVAANLRCFSQLTYQPEGQSNLIVGANGSGKTSVLEALAVASLGKSFLVNRSRDLIRNGQVAMSLQAELVDSHDHHYRVAVQKQGGETKISFDGQIVQAASDLAQRVPMIVINSKIGDVLTESPANRRALIDRTLFHVERGYIDDWKRYRQTLRQRNQLLRTGAKDGEFEFWNQQLAERALSIDGKRRELLAEINQRFAQIELRDGPGELLWEYLPGWDVEKPLTEQLAATCERDRKLGHTSLGIHRADLVLKADGKGVSRRLSRGQSKYLVVHMYLALAHYMKKIRGFAPIALIDDLSAELDDKMRGALVDIIQQGSGQQFYTAIRESDLPEIAQRTSNLFHVEQARA